MNIQTLLTQVLSRLREPRYIFPIAIILLVGGLSIFTENPEMAVGVLIGGFALVIFFTVTDLLTMRSSKVRMAIALAFPQGIDPTTVTLTNCEYWIQDPQNPGDPVKGQVLPYTAGTGWVCPIPEKAAPNHRIELYVIDDTNARWKVKPFVTETLWPSVEVNPT